MNGLVKNSKKPYILYIKDIKSKKNMLKNKDYFKSRKDLSPLSGSEQDYNPDLWNKDNNIKYTHNCYSYAMGKIIPKLKSKAQPGYASGYNHIADKDFTCESFRKRLSKDAPMSYLEKFDSPCKNGFYKVFLALDTPNDYHWWKQNSDGYWSHKPGSTEVTNLDASGKKIKNPEKSDRKFRSRNYKTPCFFACIYSELARAIDQIYSL
jgi:hypothetical protein